MDRQAITFETLSNKNDPRLYEFRKAVCIENGGDETYLQQSVSRDETYRQISTPGSNPEEVFKFGMRKWEQSSLHSLECVVVEDQIVSLSACEDFNSQVLRVGMLLYTLKKYRHKIRDHVFSENGFFSRHLVQANSLGKKAVFLSVYPYNKKLLAHAQNLTRFKRSLATEGQPYLAELEDLGHVTLKGVQQYIIGYKLDASAKWEALMPELLAQDSQL